jgi:hypothetical protein
MQARNIFTALMLCAMIALPQYASAGRYCPVTDSGAIRVDECKYGSNEACKQATGSKKDCIADILDASDKAPYCLVLGWMEICDKYYDNESCNQAAEKQAGQCIPNSRYKGPEKQ